MALFFLERSALIIGFSIANVDILSSCNNIGMSLVSRKLLIKSRTESHLGPKLPSIFIGQPITIPVMSYSFKIIISSFTSERIFFLFMVSIGEATIKLESLTAIPSVFEPGSIPNSLFLGKIFNKNSSGLKIGIIDANRLPNKVKINQWYERIKMSNNSIVDIPTVNKIARLSRLDIPEDKKQNLTNDLNNILGFVANLEEVDTSNVEPLASVTGHKLPQRNDEVVDGNIEELVLKNAPESSGGFFVVPKVIE